MEKLKSYFSKSDNENIIKKCTSIAKEIGSYIVAIIMLILSLLFIIILIPSVAIGVLIVLFITIIFAIYCIIYYAIKSCIISFKHFILKLKLAYLNKNKKKKRINYE